MCTASSFYFLVSHYFFLSAADHKLGSKAIIALLSQIDVVLEGVQLANNPSSIPRDDLQKHRQALSQSIEQHLYSLDLGLQTYRLASARLDRLDKALEHPEVEKTGHLLGEMHVSTEVSKKKELRSPSLLLTKFPSLLMMIPTWRLHYPHCPLPIPPNPPFKQPPHCKHRICLCLA